MDRKLLDEQICYYRARASEYDDWFYRRGRYDHGEAHRQAWFTEITEVEAALQDAKPDGHVLELACGTGLWTRHLVKTASEITAVDASPEVIQLNKERIRSASVRYVEADLFSWQPHDVYDFAFFGFWLSHVPTDCFESFWTMVRAALKPGGTAFFIDSGSSPKVAPKGQVFPEPGSHVMDRELNDGRRFRVVKIIYEPDALERRLASLGWEGYVRTAGQFVIYGSLRAC